MGLPPRLRKIALVVHVTSSVGWMGAVGAFLALAIAGVASTETQHVRSAYVAMDLTTRYVIVPLAFASFVTGLLQSLGTHWGLFRHWWVVVKLAVTVVATLVLLNQLEPISYLADAAVARSLEPADLRSARTGLIVHAGGGLLVLLLPTVLSIFKPRGLTAIGLRRIERSGQALVRQV